MSDNSQSEIDSLADQLQVIENLSHYEMARLYRFAPTGHPYFIRDTPACGAFHKRWMEFGGWNPTLSKQIGWDK